MRELKVTGIAQENDFDSDGLVQYLLVFNKGELRVPVSQEAAQQVLQFIYVEANGQAEPSDPEKFEEDDTGKFGGDSAAEESDDFVDEDGVGQV